METAGSGLEFCMYKEIKWSKQVNKIAIELADVLSLISLNHMETHNFPWTF